MTAPKRRWLRYSLRTLFVVITLFGCWLGYELNWVRQRRMVLSDPQVQSATYHNSVAIVAKTGQALTSRVYEVAPWPLCWLGEPGYSAILLGKGSSANEAARVRRLFPESEVQIDEP